MKSTLNMQIISSLFFCLIYLSNCEYPNTHQYTKSEQDSIIKAEIQKFTTLNQTNLNLTAQKIQAINLLIDSLQTEEIHPKTADISNKLPLKFPACGGYSDSCRFASENLTMLLLSSTIKGEKSKLTSQNFVPHEINTHFRNFQKIRRGEYRPLQFKDSPFNYVLDNLSNDCYNMQMLWQAHYYLILDIIQYKAPTNEFGGGKMSAYWHFFEARDTVKHQFSFAFEAANTQNFQPPNSTEKQVSRNERTTRYLPNGQRITENKVKTETKTNYLNEEEKYYYARKNLYDNFKQASEKAINQFFENEKGGKIYIF